MSTLARFPWGAKVLSNTLNSQEITTDPPMRLQLFEFGKLLTDFTAGVYINKVIVNVYCNQENTLCFMWFLSYEGQDD